MTGRDCWGGEGRGGEGGSNNIKTAAATCMMYEMIHAYRYKG